MTSLSQISIIVPVYNCAKYLPQCIESILAQTYTNLQIILIDDGSADSSGQICDEYAQKDTRIVVIHQKNAGVSAARNVGLHVAKGEYIGFVDGDDYIASDMYEYLYGLIQKYNTPISVCNFFKLTDHCEVASPVTTEGAILTTNQALSSLIKQLFMCNKLFSHQLLENITFSTDISYGEDMLVLLEVFQRAKQIIYGSKPCYYYRQHKSSATCSQKWNPKHVGYIAATNAILDYASENNISELVVKLRISQINMAISFLRDCLVNGPFDENSVQKLQAYFKNHLKELLLSKIKLSKKVFVLCSFVNLNLAKRIYILLQGHKK